MKARQIRKLRKRISPTGIIKRDCNIGCESASKWTRSISLNVLSFLEVM